MPFEVPPQIQVELAVKKTDKISKNLHTPGVLWFLIVAMLVLLAVSVSFFNDGQSAAVSISRSPFPSEEDETQSRVYTVSYKGGVFSPTNLRIRAGDTVRFKNDGILSIKILSDPEPEQYFLPGFDSIGDVPQGSFFSFTFATKGIFGYHNGKSPSEKGIVIVR